MKNNINIFVCENKDSTPIMENESYITINNNNIKENVNLPIDDKFYSELYQFKYVADNVKLPKYVGFCNNKRFFSFLNDIPDMDDVFKKFDCIIPKPIELNMNVTEHYKECHNIEDLEIIKNIIKRKYKSYYEPCEKVLNGNILVPYNMFIMKRSDFKKYCKFVFGTINEYIKIVGTDIKKRIEENNDKYIKNFYPNNTIEYQYGLGKFIAERLTNIFLMKNFTKMKICDTIVTE